MTGNGPEIIEKYRFSNFTWEIDHAHKRSFLIPIVARIQSLGYKQKHLSCPWFPELYYYLIVLDEFRPTNLGLGEKDEVVWEGHVLKMDSDLLK